MMMPKFPFKRNDRYIYRSSRETVPVTRTWTAMAMATVTATTIDVYGLRWDYSDRAWWERHFSNRKVKR